MNGLIEPARLSFAPDGTTPYSETYGDVYHSAAGGLAQARYVFLAGNGLPERWLGRDSFTILETGFGLGVNFMATWQAWRADPRRCRTLQFLSVEKHPFAAADLAQAHAAWPELSGLSEPLCRGWPPLNDGEHRVELEHGQIILRLVFGDAAEHLPALGLRYGAIADAFYLDGFSPARNPELWSSEICRALARLAAPGATLATWSVAGPVRRSLRDAGFSVEKRTGFADKRQMLTGGYASEPACFAPAKTDGPAQ